MAPTAAYALTTTVDTDVATTIAAAREALADQGFGILTEIDLAATLREKIGAEIPAHVVLGACRPPLAHRAVTAEPAIGVLLPCNVTVRADGERSVVEAMDPGLMVGVTGNPALTEVAEDARGRIVAALTALDGTPVV